MILNDPLLRPAVFLILLVLFMTLEQRFPRRCTQTRDPYPRWVGNFGILLIGTVLARLILPIVPIGAAVWAAEQDVGILNWLSLNLAMEGLIAFVALDLLIYAQHRVFHAVPMLWRVHRMHHSDLEFDVTTGIRFHPIEILLSLVIKIAAVILIGAHPIAVLVFEIILNATSLFNHSNLALPRSLDRTLRLFIVTPDMHRVHHSVSMAETNSNFGFNLPWWDYLFDTYRSQPLWGHSAMNIGLSKFRGKQAVGLVRLLLQPFK